MQQVPEPGAPSSAVPTPPAQRIGDADRDAAVERLRTAHAEGRITAEEFDERVGRALTARTSADLAPLFADLPPGPGPASALAGATPLAGRAPMAAAPESGSASAGAKVWWSLYSVMWPLFIVVSMLTHQWGLMAIPAVLGPVFFGGARRQNSRQARRELHDEYRQRRRELRGR